MRPAAARWSVPQVQRFLADQLDVRARAVQRLSTGAWSEAFAFKWDGRPLVVRFSALEEDFRKDEHAARWRSPVLPIPEVLAVGKADPGFYAVSERLFGDDIDDRSEPELRVLIPSLLGMLDALRVVDVSSRTGYGVWGADANAPYGTWAETLLDVARDRPEQRHHGWRRRLAASPTGDGPFREAHDALAALVPGLPAGRHLIHGDLLYRNVLVTGDRITGLLDWGSAMYGDALFDLAWICFWSAWYPAWRAIDWAAEARGHLAATGLIVAGFDERLRACQLYIGLEGQGYQAFHGRWDEVAWTAARTLEIARGR